MSEREAWVWRNGELVEKGGPLDIRPPVARGAFPTPAVIGDTQPDLICHADGKRYSSKSAMRKAVKAAGCVELGNDAASFRREPAVERITKREIGEALQKVRQGYKPAPLETSVLPEP
jgi:hypothetical protein